LVEDPEFRIHMVGWQLRYNKDENLLASWCLVQTGSTNEEADLFV